MLNEYGDKLLELGGYGGDIASQRADDLDEICLRRVRITSMTGMSSALDIATGLGGQAKRMSDEGARVTAVDLVDHFQHKDRIRFELRDMRDLSGVGGRPFDVISCQRAIHYLPFKEAVAALANWKQLVKPEALLFISASGLGSELGTGYPAADLPDRWAPLAPDMAHKHSIAGPVCLYSEGDLIRLLTEAGWSSMMTFTSAFGNVKAVATC